MLTTTINWIPGAPVDPKGGSVWLTLTKQMDHNGKYDNEKLDLDGIKTISYESEVSDCGTVDAGFGDTNGNEIDPESIAYHAPYEPPKAERINTSAREMIEAEIESVQGKIRDSKVVSMSGGWVIHGLRIALEHLDKPAEPRKAIIKCLDPEQDDWICTGCGYELPLELLREEDGWPIDMKHCINCGTAVEIQEEREL